MKYFIVRLKTKSKIAFTQEDFKNIIQNWNHDDYEFEIEEVDQ
jgi:hypothetical protein